MSAPVDARAPFRSTHVPSRIRSSACLVPPGRAWPIAALVGGLLSAPAGAQQAVTLDTLSVAGSGTGTPLPAGSLNLRSEARSASRLGLTPLETPASVDVIAGETTRLRGQNTVAEAVTQNATGITTVAAPGNGNGAFTARGFRRPELDPAALRRHPPVRGCGHRHLPVRHLERGAHRGAAGARFRALRRRGHRRRGQRGDEEAAVHALQRGPRGSRFGRARAPRPRFRRPHRRSGRLSPQRQRQPGRGLDLARREFSQPRGLGRPHPPGDAGSRGHPHHDLGYQEPAATGARRS